MKRYYHKPTMLGLIFMVSLTAFLTLATVLTGGLVELILLTVMSSLFTVAHGVMMLSENSENNGKTLTTKVEDVNAKKTAEAKAKEMYLANTNSIKNDNDLIEYANEQKEALNEDIIWIGKKY